MKYFEYKKYQIKLTLWRYLFIAILCLLVYGYYKAYQHGISIKAFIDFMFYACCIIAIIYITVKILIRLFRKKKYLNSPLAKIDTMSGKEFEQYLKAHFEKLGYKVKLTQDAYDYGADLICKNKDETLIIQAKRYKSKVSNSAIQEIVAAKKYYKANRCMVVTNSYFTKAAIELAKANEVELWDRDNINLKLIKKENKKEKD